MRRGEANALLFTEWKYRKQCWHDSRLKRSTRLTLTLMKINVIPISTKTMNGELYHKQPPPLPLPKVRIDIQPVDTICCWTSIGIIYSPSACTSHALSLHPNLWAEHLFQLCSDTSTAIFSKNWKGHLITHNSFAPPPTLLSFRIY